ncbi:MAG: class I SAM-dependent methyltransferase [Woeseiaceae bacterium]
MAACIRQAIEDAGGSISFAEFMQWVLYAPGLGYYNAGAAKFGAGGDFVTAPEVSPLFGRVLARQCASVLQQFPVPQVLELGAGSGALAVQMLRALSDFGLEPARYAILEVSPDLKERQERLIRGELPALRTRVEWSAELPEHFDGVVVANEVADALPVERFQKDGNRVLQMRVTTERNRFAWCREKAPEFLEAAVRRIEETLGAALPDGYTSEVSTALPHWIHDIAARVGTGFVFLFDYGLPRREYYAPDRDDGWLRCHFRQCAHNNPLVYPGIQDLTAWVDFTAVAEAASAAGMNVAGFVTQAQFLMSGGLQEELVDMAKLPTVAQLELSRQVKLLTLPGEMGEHFKCLGLCRGQLAIPASFTFMDRAHTL